MSDAKRAMTMREIREQLGHVKTGQLPPPSDALTVHTAAAHLRSLAERAAAAMVGNDYWQSGWAVGVSNAIGGDEGELAARFSPEVVRLFADWLDECASANARHGAEIPAAALAITAATHPAP